MQLIENIKTFTVQILHHIQKRKCVPCGHRDAGFAHTDEILAIGAEPHKLPVGLCIHSSTWPPNQYRTEVHRASHPASEVTRNARRGRDTSGPCKHLSFGDMERSALLPTAHNGTLLGFKTSRWMETQWLRLCWLKAAGTDPRVWR